MKVERIEPAQKVRAPREVTIVQLKAEIRRLKRELKDMRATNTDILRYMRIQDVATTYVMDTFAPSCLRDDCTCTPTRADFLRAIARD
jgi:hypothetical protein